MERRNSGSASLPRGRSGAKASSSPHPTKSTHAPVGSLLAAAMDQEGSLRVQRSLKTMSPLRLQATCDELGPHLRELCTHPFANYLVSKLAGLAQGQGHVRAALTGRVVELMAHPQGSRVVQATLEALPVSEACALVDELRGSVAECAATTYGSWSVCAAFKATHAPFLITEIANAVVPLSVTQNGTRVVQRILPEAASHYPAGVHEIIGALIRSGPSGLCRTADDEYGNYVVQAALRLAATCESDGQHAQLVALLLPCLQTLSMSKFGSNTSEVLIQYATKEQLVLARDVLSGCAMGMASHFYGRHVVQTLQRRLGMAGA